MSKFVFVSPFTNIVRVNSRTRVIADRVEGGITVLIPDFNHQNKRYYEPGEANHVNQKLLHVPAYKKNLSLSRIWSHVVFAKKVNRYLNSQKEEPSVVYCAMPTSSAAYVCARYCKRHGVKFVIDVIDLWPDSLLPLTKGRKVIKAMLYPWTYLTRYAYRYADVIMAESVKYAQEVKKYNKVADVYPVYLGVDKNIINKVKVERPVVLTKPKDELWIAYAGSLGTSYDFETLLDAVKTIHGKYKYKLWFVGDGVKHEEIENYISKNRLNAEITGFVDYERLLGYLTYCDIAINIFKPNTKVEYSYKFNDYVATDCFVLNSLKGETAEMVDEYKIGRNFNFSNQPLGDVLNDTLAHWNEYAHWNKNCQQLIMQKLDKEKIYRIVKDIFYVKDSD